MGSTEKYENRKSLEKKKKAQNAEMNEIGKENIELKMLGENWKEKKIVVKGSKN